jgi:hypothetical protein
LIQAQLSQGGGSGGGGPSNNYNPYETINETPTNSTALQSKQAAHLQKFMGYSESRTLAQPIKRREGSVESLQEASSISPKRSIKSSLPQSQLMSVVNGGDSAISSPDRKRLKASAKKGTLTVNRGGSKLNVMKPSSSMTNLVQTTDSVGKSGI